MKDRIDDWIYGVGAFGLCIGGGIHGFLSEASILVIVAGVGALAYGMKKKAE